MKTIYNNFSELITPQLKQLTENQLCEEYRKELNPQFYAMMFIKHFGLIKTITKKFATLDNADVDGVVLDVLDKAMQLYTEEKQTKFTTYFTRILKNKLVDMVRKTKAAKRDFVMCELSAMEYDSTVMHTDQYLRLIFDDVRSILTKTEFDYFKLFVDGWTNTDIAEFNNVSSANVSKTKSRIQQKVFSIVLDY
jgi:DNA-directed RNA polymerase specialized sigma subunit, sigma24 homolog